MISTFLFILPLLIGTILPSVNLVSNIVHNVYDATGMLLSLSITILQTKHENSKMNNAAMMNKTKFEK